MNEIEKQKSIIRLSQVLQDTGLAPELAEAVLTKHRAFLDTEIVVPTPQEKVMDKGNLLRIRLDALDQEIVGIHRARVLLEVKISDAATPTGNAEVDSSLRNQAENARKSLLAQDRMLETRETKIAELKAQMDALTKET